MVDKEMYLFSSASDYIENMRVGGHYYESDELAEYIFTEAIKSGAIGKLLKS
jgi:hypothetical protein